MFPPAKTKSNQVQQNTRTHRLITLALANQSQHIVKLTPIKITPKAAQLINFYQNSSPPTIDGQEERATPLFSASLPKSYALSSVKRCLFNPTEVVEGDNLCHQETVLPLPVDNFAKGINHVEETIHRLSEVPPSPTKFAVLDNVHATNWSNAEQDYDNESNVVDLSQVIKTKSCCNDVDGYSSSASDFSDGNDTDYVPETDGVCDTDEEILELVEEKIPSVQISNMKDMEALFSNKLTDPAHSANKVNIGVSNNHSIEMLQLPPELTHYQSLLPECNRCFYDEAAVETVLAAAGGRKYRKSFCPYCKKNIAQLPRHVENVHKNEELVSKLSALPKGDPERQNILRAMRLWGTYIFNNSRFFNQGILKVYRRPIGPTGRTGSDYISCANCGLLIFKRRYGRHYDKCTQREKAGFRSRESILAGRMLNASLHRNANKILRERIFPVLRIDDCVKAIRFDEAVIAYGNNQSLKYSTSTHHDKMIRANLRMLGRVLLAAIGICQDVNNYASLLIPSRANVVRDAINRVADLEETTGTFKHPNSATQAAFVIKDLSLSWKTECIKKEDFSAEKNVERFLSILQIQIIPIIDKIVTENRTRAQRQKKVEMPTLADIQILNRFLTHGYTKCANELKSATTFNYDTWKMLGSYSVVALLVFNKRRPGETDQLFLENFSSVMKLDKNLELYSTLDEKEKALANRNMLLVTRGKLNRTVPALMSPCLKNALDLFVTFRKQAGVSELNPYVFGLPNTEINLKRYKHLDSCSLLRLFSEKCNAKNPKTLRATILRKSLATLAASLQLPENITKELADHMGHDVAIHKNIYRQVTYQKSVLNVASALEKAVGGHNEFDNNADTQPESQVSIKASSLSQLLIPQDSVSTTTIVPAYPSSAPAQKVETPQSSNSKTHPTTRSLRKQQSYHTPQKIKARTTISSSPLSKPQEIVALKYYMAKRTELNRSPVAADMQDALTLPELKNKSLPNLMLHLYRVIPKPGTPKKRRYVQTPQKPNQAKEYAKRRRNSSQRKPWTEAALAILEKVFSNYLQGTGNTMPSKAEIELSIQKYRVLTGRSVPVVKACLNNMWKLRRCHR